jgi:hypothetical protein
VVNLEFSLHSRANVVDVQAFEWACSFASAEGKNEVLKTANATKELAKSRTISRIHARGFDRTTQSCDSTLKSTAITANNDHAQAIP